jgi:hypothetical protein
MSNYQSSVDLTGTGSIHISKLHPGDHFDYVFASTDVGAFGIFQFAAWMLQNVRRSFNFSG